MKPVYSIPTMTEVGQVKPNGFKVASTFSGCGGSSLGYRMAGFKVVWASEFVSAAQEVYRLNNPKTVLDTRDIRTVSADDILSVNKDIDILDGSPPCASFSTSGSRSKNWGKVSKYSDRKQRTDDLFYEFSRILEGVRPKVFVAENVSGLVKGKAKGYFIEIIKRLKSCGYRVSCRVLDSQWLGVPQARQRTIFIGVRDDLKIDPAHPKPLNYRYGIKDALPYIVSQKKGGSPDNWCTSLTPSQTIMASGGTLSPTAYLSGGAFIETKEGQRRMTIEEVKRLSSFPSDFKLTGTFAQQWERIGRAVPPVMMLHISKTIETQILNKIK